MSVFRGLTCLGNMCPPSLEMINTPRFVIRAGIIPYTPPSASSPGIMLLGIKQGKYTDFGGGCKVSKSELPFDCALREMREEAGNEIRPNLDNITHVFISGKNKPHQLVLLIKVDGTLRVPTKIPKGELEGVKLVTFTQFSNFYHRDLSDSLKSIYGDVRYIVDRME